MNINELKKSNYLQRSDLPQPALVTIKHAESLNLAKDGAPEEIKRCLHFLELEKPMVMNFTNAQIIAKITGQDDDDNWGGHKVVIYDDPNVSFGGKLTGGIRVRAPRIPVKPAPTQPSAPRPPAPIPSDDPKPIGNFMPKPETEEDPY